MLDRLEGSRSVCNEAVFVPDTHFARRNLVNVIRECTTFICQTRLNIEVDEVAVLCHMSPMDVRRVKLN